MLVAGGLGAQDPAPASAPSPALAAKVAALTAQIRAENLERTVRELVGFGTRQTLSPRDDPKRGTGAARNHLEARLRAIAEGSGGRLVVARETYTEPSQRLGREVEVVNIVARLEGGEPGRVFVIGGHYDSINSDRADPEGDAPGANDDASGVAVVLEACRLLSTVPLRATILFVCYDGEEFGLLGSTGHAKALSQAGARVEGMITNDIVGNTRGLDGRTHDSALRCFSYSARGNDSTSRSLARAATWAARTHVPGFAVQLVYRGDRYGRGGDHQPFFANGFPALRFSELREDWSRQHKKVTQRDGRPYGDLPEYVDFAYLAKVCAVNVALLAELASAPPAPAQVNARGATDRYAVQLRWPAATGAAAYEAVWRLTTAPDWEHARLLGPDTQAVLADVLLDDVVVGVRSVGADGSRSMATTPPEPDALAQRPPRNR